MPLSTLTGSSSTTTTVTTNNLNSNSIPVMSEMEMITATAIGTAGGSNTHDIESHLRPTSSTPIIDILRGDGNVQTTAPAPPATAAMTNIHETMTAFGIPVQDTTATYYPYPLATATTTNEDHQHSRGSSSSPYLPTASASAGQWARRRVPGD